MFGGAGHDTLTFAPFSFTDIFGVIEIRGDLQSGATLRAGGTVIARLFEIEALSGVIDSSARVTGGRDGIRMGEGTDTFGLIGGGSVDVRYSGEGPGPHRVIAAGAVQVTVHDAERFDIEWGFGDDRLTGGASHDRLEGRGGDDRLDGGRGTNAMPGGGGADTFVFAEGPRFGLPAVVNTILDFDGEDRAELDVSAFGGGLAPGEEALIVYGTAPVAPAGTTSGVFPFDAATRLLAYDSNGALGGGVTSLATLTGSSIAADQIDIV